MPLRLEVASSLSRSHLVFLIKPIAACKLSLVRIRAPTYRACTRRPHGIQAQQKKTYAAQSAFSLSSQSSMKHKRKEEETRLYDTHKEDPPTAGQHGPPSQHSFFSMVLSPPLSPPFRHSDLSFPQYSLLLLNSISLAACGAFIALVATAIPTLNAMRRAAVALERLADTAREELPGTMAAVRLSGMEISDLTLELSDLSQEISESVRSSARAVRAAEVGIRRMGSAAASQTLSILQEHASVPVEAVRPVVANAAETTRQAMSQAHKAVLGLAGMPVLSNWIQKKKLEEQKKIEEGMSRSMKVDSSSEFDKSGDQDLMADC